MRVALVLHGDAPSPAELALLAGCDAVVCADGGALAVLDAGRVPELIVGDLDSLPEALAREAQSRGAELRRLPAAKDHTDGERALEAVLAMRPASVLVLGAHGGRTAMQLANLSLLRRCHEAGVPARMVGHGETLHVVGPDRDLALDGLRGATLNVLAVAGPAVVSLRGLAWEAERLRLDPLGARGVSNPIVRAQALLRVHEGLALAIVEHQP